MLITVASQKKIAAAEQESFSSNSNNSRSNSEKSGFLSSAPGGETRFIRIIHSLYKRWASFIADYSWPLIFLCILLTTICTIKIILTPQKNDITGYTPYGARSRKELAIREQFFGASGENLESMRGGSFGALVLIRPKPGHGNNLLRMDLLDEVLQVDDFVRHNITIINHRSNNSQSFAEFCRDFCELNEPLRNFHKAYQYQRDRLMSNETADSHIQLNYPVANLYGRRVNIQLNFYGVTLLTDNGSVVDAAAMPLPLHHNPGGQLTNMKSVALIALVYKAERLSGNWSDDEVRAYEMAIARFFEKKYSGDRLHVMVMSTTYLEIEVVRAGLSMLPFLAVGFTIMLVCSSLTVLVSAAYMQQVSVYKIVLAVAACVCPFMACGTALGLLFFCGVRFGSILCVTPFLVLAIGVDDAYLMIHAWQRISREMMTNPTGEDNIAHRLALVLMDTGPAILISALTNILADGVGSLTGSPEVTLLCVGNAAAMVVDFIYQITFYSSVMAIVGRREMKQQGVKANKCSEERLHPHQNVDHRLSITIGSKISMPSMGSKSTLQVNEDHHPVAIGAKPPNNPQTTFRGRVTSTLGSSIATYVDIITKPAVSTLVVLVWIGFLVISSIGISKFEVNLTTKKLFGADSPLLEIDQLREDIIVPTYSMTTIFILNPDTLTRRKLRQRLFTLVKKLESLPESWGADGTNFFLRDYIDFEKAEEMEPDEVPDADATTATKTTKLLMGGDAATTNQTSSEEQATSRLDLNDLEKFLTWPESKFWRPFLKYHKKNVSSTPTIDSFFFTAGYHGTKLKSWSERAYLMEKWRAVVDEFPDLNASVYHDEGIFLDLIENMPSDMWQSALATLLCMALICLIFMYNTFTVVVAAGIIGSIIVGMLGMLSWAGVSMDPIMMAALIISTGFSVDIPAHISYHYYSAGFQGETCVKKRLKVTLASVGFPAIQASLSTSLCVLSLLFVPLYMAHIFVQIMCTCIVLCVLHGLVVLPAIFTMLGIVTGWWKSSN